MSGFDGQTILDLVRNPDYDPKTDSPAARQSLPDEFRFTVDPNVTDIVDRVAAGELEDENAAEPAAAGARAVLHRLVEEAVPPRPPGRPRPVPDDEPDPAAVRRHPRAPGHELDHRQGRAPTDLRRPSTGKIAGHIVPDSIFDNQLADYDPYGHRATTATSRRPRPR